MKTIITSNVVQKSTLEADNSGNRRSSRAKQPTNKKMESMSSPCRPTTNGTPRSSRSIAPQSTASTNSKFQNNLLAELSRKSSNFSPDVVSDLEEILGSPIKTRDIPNEQASRTHLRSDHANANANAKGSGMVRVDYKAQTDDDLRPTTRTSKRLSNRIQITSHIEPVAKASKSSTATKSNAKKQTQMPLSQDDHLSSEESQESQESQDESSYNHLHMTENPSTNIVMNIKQEKEVSFTMTDENSVFTCEMCSAVFSDRTQLLVHVPVHI